MNHYLQVPKRINLSILDYFEKMNIAYEPVDDFDRPEDLPGIIDFAGRELDIGDISTYKIDADADKVRDELETAIREHRIRELCKS